MTALSSTEKFVNWANQHVAEDLHSLYQEYALIRGSDDILEIILEAVCEYFALDMDVVKSKCRKRPHSMARYHYCYLARLHTQYTLKQVGGILNGRDYSTVIYAVETITDLIETEPRTKKDHIKLNEIAERLVILHTERDNN